ncbi:MAG: hypothetical protein HMLKMBBP_02671 [Planctomycetes bacterium]|nr:hypothetical protein [Planctomycetota bacterium]
MKRLLRTLGLALAAAASFLPPAGAALSSPSDADQKLAEMREKVMLVINGDASGVERANAIGKLADVDSAESAKILVEAVDALALKYDQDEKDYAATLKQYEPFRGFTLADRKDWEVKARIQGMLEKQEDRLQSDAAAAQAAVVVVMRARSPNAITLYEKSLKATLLFHSRLIWLGGLVRNPNSKAIPFAQAALKDEDPRVRLAVYEAFAERKDPAAVDVLVKALAEKDWPLRQAVVRAIAAQGDVRGVPPLVAQMQLEDGALLIDYANALQALTGESLGNFPEAWHGWYEAHKAELAEKGAKAVSKPVAKTEPKVVDYYGIQVPSKKVLFLFDVSGSMEEKIGEDKGSVTGVKKDVYTGRKIDVARKIMNSTIRALPADATFEIVFFNHQVQSVFGKMTPATPENKAKAELAVEEIPPKGATWTYGALRQGFELAKSTCTAEAMNPCVDTIFLLSDGAPTDDSFDKAKLMEPKEILDAVNEWNREFKIRIHTIAIDPRLQHGNLIRLMKDLAGRHHGLYRAIGAQ